MKKWLVKYFSTTKFHDAASLYPEMAVDRLERMKFLNSFHIHQTYDSLHIS